MGTRLLEVARLRLTDDDLRAGTPAASPGDASANTNVDRLRLLLPYIALPFIAGILRLISFAY